VGSHMRLGGGKEDSINDSKNKAGGKRYQKIGPYKELHTNQRNVTGGLFDTSGKGPSFLVKKGRGDEIPQLFWVPLVQKR